jgi:Flp pilus assembly protein TadG
MTIALGWPSLESIFSTTVRFRRDRRGAAVSEFTMILPFVLLLFTGAITYGDAIAIDRKVTLTTHTVTDLVTQYTTLSTAELQTLLNASSSIVAPYSASNISVVVSEVSTDASKNATVVWSQPAGNGVALTKGASVTLPPAIDLPNVTYIWGQVSYTYTPSIGYEVTGPIVLTDQTYMSPRLSTTVALTP